MPQHRTTDCLIVGGGVIGLSIAHELAAAGASVRVVERASIGREASWAGAGILPPGSWFSDHPAAEALAAACRPRHVELSRQLLEQTGVDDEFTQTGSLYVATSSNRRDLKAKFADWRRLGLSVRQVDAESARGIEPAAEVGDAFYVPDETQVRNPRRLAALRRACEVRGVMIESRSGAARLLREGDRVWGVQTAQGRRSAGQCVLAAGAWSGEIAAELGVEIPVRPVRGQILLLRPRRPVLRRIVHRGGLYLVPRRDGRVLVGSTVEEAGFDKSSRVADVAALHRFATRLAPALADAQVEADWVGLRPGSVDGLPLIGPLPGLRGGWIAAGHFRAGLQFAPATATIVRQMLTGEPTQLPIGAFAPDRFTRDRRAGRAAASTSS